MKIHKDLENIEIQKMGCIVIRVNETNRLVLCRFQREYIF